MSLTDKQFFIVLGVGALALLYMRKKAGEAVQAVADTADEAVQAVNPVNENNMFNSGVNKIVQFVTGEKDVMLGTMIYDWLHSNEGV